MVHILRLGVFFCSMLTACIFACNSYAVATIDLTQESPLSHPEQEAQAQALFHELRCMVCDGQSIADSNAALAADMRHRIRQQVAAGASPKAIIQFFVDHYGDAVRMEPPLGAHTLLLWGGPLLLLLGGLLVIRRAFGRQGR